MNTPRMIDIPVVEIDPEFRDLIPIMTTEEKEGLERSLIKDGCLDPLVVWTETNLLLDGHRRLEICKRNNIEFQFKHLSFSTREDAKIWIILQQLGRRNLTPNQAKYLRGIHYNLEKGIVGQHTNAGTSSERIAREYGVSERTIRNAGKFAEKVNLLPQEEKTRVLSERMKRPRKISEHGEDSRALSQLKLWWAKANQEDRGTFFLWVQTQSDGENGNAT